MEKCRKCFDEGEYLETIDPRPVVLGGPPRQELHMVRCDCFCGQVLNWVDSVIGKGEDPLDCMTEAQVWRAFGKSRKEVAEERARRWGLSD